MTAARQLVHVLDPKTAFGEEAGRETSSRKRDPWPKKEHHLPRSPESDGEWERKCAILLFLSLSPSSSLCVSFLVLPRRGVFSLFAWSFLVPVHIPFMPLSLPLAPPAGHDDDEEDDHSSDTTSDGQCQKEKLWERGCRRETQECRLSTIA